MMKTENEINDDILKIITVIENKSPELSKYIAEMSINIPDNPTAEIKIKHLLSYYDSLAELLKKYTESHEDIVLQ